MRTARKLQMTFFVQCYEEIDGQLKFNGMRFEGYDLGGNIPTIGDSIVSPLTTRSPDEYFAFDVLKRYFVPDITQSTANEVKVLVQRRPLSDAECELFKASK